MIIPAKIVTKTLQNNHKKTQNKTFNNCDVDVKTASKGSHKYLMVPDAQLAKHKTQVFVGVRILNLNQAEVCGYALRKDLGPINDLGFSVPTSGLLFSKLRPINKMIEQCKKVMG